MDNLDNLFSDFLLSMLNESNASLISELRARWKEYMATPVIDFKQSNQSKKEPLFTTEDEKEIFEGEKFFFIDIDYSIKEYTAHEHHYNDGILLKRSLSTKEAAQNYVFEHKPCMSFREVVNLCVLTNYAVSNLAELVKSKLNL